MAGEAVEEQLSFVTQRLEETRARRVAQRSVMPYCRQVGHEQEADPVEEQREGNAEERYTFRGSMHM